MLPNDDKDFQLDFVSWNSRWRSNETSFLRISSWTRFGCETKDIYTHRCPLYSKIQRSNRFEGRKTSTKTIPRAIMSNLLVADLFSVKGMVFVITGAGTGTYPFNLWTKKGLTPPRSQSIVGKNRRRHRRSQGLQTARSRISSRKSPPSPPKPSN